MHAVYVVAACLSAKMGLTQVVRRHHITSSPPFSSFWMAIWTWIELQRQGRFSSMATWRQSVPSWCREHPQKYNFLFGWWTLYWDTSQARPRSQGRTSAYMFAKGYVSPHGMQGCFVHPLTGNHLFLLECKGCRHSRSSQFVICPGACVQMQTVSLGTRTHSDVKLGAVAVETWYTCASWLGKPAHVHRNMAVWTRPSASSATKMSRLRYSLRVNYF